MPFVFSVSRGRDYAASGRQSVYDQSCKLMADRVVQGSDIEVGPVSDVFGKSASDRIGLYDADRGAFFAAFDNLTPAGALHAGTGGFLFDLRAFTGNATLFGGRWGDVLTGGSGDDALFGNQGADVLTGGLGDDRLDGGRGADTLIGGKGDDTYFVDAAGDVLREAAGDGSDTVYATASYTLRAGVAVEIMALAPATGTKAFALTGNEFANTLTGNDGANRLDGKGGIDYMVGGKGDDVYFVDHWDDRAIEAKGGGRDTVYASEDHCFLDGQEVEVLIANAGDRGLHLMGNELAQTIIGGAGDDTLHGDGGADILTGAGGKDRFAFVARVDATPGRDRPTVTDFTQGQDTIFLARLQAVDGAETDQAFTWVGVSAFSGVAGELHQRALGSDSLIEGDTNGDTIADIEILLKGVHVLQAGDFTL